LTFWLCHTGKDLILNNGKLRHKFLFLYKLKIIAKLFHFIPQIKKVHCYQGAKKKYKMTFSEEIILNHIPSHGGFNSEVSTNAIAEMMETHLQ
jgi:hypothetical protein